MHDRTKLIAGAGTVALFAAAVAFAPPVAHDDGAPAADETAESVETAETPEGKWKIRALSPRIIGGYGDNFAYDGSNVRHLDGHVTMEFDGEAGTTHMVVEVETTEESGPIHFSSGKKWEGKIRVVQKIDTDQMKKARLAEDVTLHGNTGREAPVMPKIYNYFATWGPAKVFVNGEEVISKIGSHCMFTEQSRDAEGKIADESGKPYNPKRAAESGFTNPNGLEFHFVMHTTEPDKNNFPPHTGWVHLHFSDVVVLEKPADAEIPYTQAD